MRSTDDCFIQCNRIECFPEHDFINIAERVQMCKYVKDGSYVFGKANWD